jgi:hypothetical protein
MELTGRKPKNARVKRALEKREPQIIENEKTAIFVRGQNTSEKVRIAMKDLVRILFPSKSNKTDAISTHLKDLKQSISHVKTLFIHLKMLLL